ncbi:sterol desaturase family protein [Duganella sp. FT135W]|uniref:Sterol desaturase family protein n=1 Tax=Duganella flavida TaxID=2692175 RepID=A0A6L8KF30_9BURK|nr:sterol desaturase family protein [Duganella flavida]
MNDILAYLPTFAVNVVRLGVWLVLLSLVFVPLERWLSVRKVRLSRRALAINLGLYFLNSLLPAAILSALMAVVAVGAQAALPAALPAAVGALPLVIKLLLSLLIAEVGFYWGHRLSHKLPWLWHFHAVHHQPEHLYFLINTHAHPVDMIVTRLFGMTPLYILGLAGASAGGSVTPALVIIIGTVWGFFIHSNLRVRLGPLESLIATPAFHHWHHTSIAPLDRNFSSTLPFLDRVFGTWYLPDSWPLAYGIANAPVKPSEPAN